MFKEGTYDIKEVFPWDDSGRKVTVITDLNEVFNEGTDGYVTEGSNGLVENE